MDDYWQKKAEEICNACGGECCRHAHPPISPRRRSILLSAGQKNNIFENGSYNRLKCGPDGMCIMYSDGLCTIHGCKPETCVSGPFTFDMKSGMIAIYLKHDHVCPLVSWLKQNGPAYNEHFTTAVSQIRRLFLDLPGDEMNVVLSIPEPDCDIVAMVPVGCDDT